MKAMLFEKQIRFLNKLRNINNSNIIISTITIMGWGFFMATVWPQCTHSGAEQRGARGEVWREEQNRHRGVRKQTGNETDREDSKRLRHHSILTFVLIMRAFHVSCICTTGPKPHFTPPHPNPASRGSVQAEATAKIFFPSTPLTEGSFKHAKKCHSFTTVLNNGLCSMCSNWSGKQVWSSKKFYSRLLCLKNPSEDHFGAKCGWVLAEKAKKTKQKTNT